ncbi:MAG: nitrogenase component 1, partial [archaeon]|nr:nitrogenase component 1 [archaeon]
MMLPDGFVSSVMVIESFSDMKVLLHGPVGCRRDLCFISSILCPKDPKAGPEVYRGRYYANNHRVPCTEVDGEDYISGAINRLDEALDIVSGTDDDLIAIVNTPGVSLIGENCEDLILKKGLQERVLALDADYISIPVGEGYDRTLTKLLKWLKPEKTSTKRMKVNVLGLSLFTRDWKGVLD